jgi:hypothetical protein
VIQITRFFLREDDNPSGPLSEALEHRDGARPP